ncbi:RNA polymerase, sigma 28 subunit, SigD/FliA/WhiG [Tindallia magadiensis]|uniref:RNA polymerase sigma factor n=1 Tax=Tindallia magadiensis TaxID=69895 RepID=A0A1I3AIX8_9FIRM|nr:FliA/WhiG family RNA polymerase sigma factor [Tindallia magadiensis]SFH49699.1 RNA polymerase, sigma 28 subunit, SigD/FliA/WhiG [Tindallia magadiensis]
MDSNILWQQYLDNRDANTKNQLIEKYIELVKIVAGRLYSTYGNHLDFDDLVSFGIFGLIDAIDKFNPEKNVKFETYAQIRIRGAIIDQIRNMDWIPRSIRQKSKLIDDAISKLENSSKIESITDNMIAEETGMTIREIQNVMQQTSAYNIVSLEENLIDATDENSLADAKDELPEERLINAEMKERLIKGIKELPDKEKQVITLYYYEELTYKEIGTILGVSESRVSQLHSKAISKIKYQLL